MKPRQTKIIPRKDLFQPQLVDIINPNYPLVLLAKIIDWSPLDNKLEAHILNVWCSRAANASYDGVTIAELVRRNGMGQCAVDKSHF